MGHKKVRVLHEDYGGGYQHDAEVPQEWMGKAIASIRMLKDFYGKPFRVIHIGGTVVIVFKKAELAIACPMNESLAYRSALETALGLDGNEEY